MKTLNKTISSVEVAARVDRDHNNVMKDIRRIITQIGERASYRDYFVEGSYFNQQNKEQPCYWLTKKGCELFGTRMNGQKGVLFALFYIDRFNEMEADLQNIQPVELLEDNEEADERPVAVLGEPPAMEKLRLMFEVTENTVSRLATTENRLVDLEENVGIDPGDYRYIGDIIAQRIATVARSFGEGITNEQKRLLYKDLNGSIKRITGVGARSQLRKKHYEQVVEFVYAWEPSTSTRTLIKELGRGQ